MIFRTIRNRNNRCSCKSKKKKKSESEKQVEEEANNKKKRMATDGAVIRRVSKVAAMPLRNKVPPTRQSFAINAANEEALKAVKQKFSLRNLVSKKNDDNKQN